MESRDETTDGVNTDDEDQDHSANGKWINEEEVGEKEVGEEENTVSEILLIKIKSMSEGTFKYIGVNITQRNETAVISQDLNIKNTKKYIKVRQFFRRLCC